MNQVLLWVLIPILVLLCLISGVLFYIIIRSQQRIISKISSIEANGTASHGANLIGSPLPTFRAQTTKGTWITDTELMGEEHALFFVSPNCPTCSATAIEVEALANKVRDRIIFVCLGHQGDCIGLEAQLDSQFQFIVDTTHQLGNLFHVLKTPLAVISDAEGNISRIGSPFRKEDLEVLSEELFLGKAKPRFHESSPT